MLLVSILRPILLAQLKILSHVMVVPRMVQISPTDTALTQRLWEPLGAPLPPKTPVSRNFIHPKQFGIFPKRLSLPYPDEEILSGYEEDVSSIWDGFFQHG